MKKTLYFLMVPGFLFLDIQVGKTQVVNIESQRIQKNKEGIYGWVSIDANYTQNVQRVWQVGNESKVLYKKNRSGVFLFSDFSLLQGETSELINQGFGHLRYNHRLTKSPFLTAEVFEQVQYNKVQKIDVRALSGAGLRFQLIPSDSVDFYAGVTMMYEYEEITGTDIVHRDARFSSYISLDIPIGKIVDFNNIVYYQPLATRFADFRVSNQTQFLIRISKKLQYKIEFDYLHDDNPPVGIPKDIYSLENGLTLNF